MKSLAAALGLLLLCFLLPAGAGASTTYDNGYTDSSGYVYNNGYWFYGGVGDPYVRDESWLTYPGYYDRYYRWVPAYQYATYSYRRAYPATVAKTANWREKIVDAVKAREAAFNTMAVNELENRAYFEALKVAGFPAALPTPGVSGAYGGYGGGLQVGHFGTQGQTVYGGTFNQTKSVLEIYGDLSPALLEQGVVRATEQAGDNLDRAHDRLATLAKLKASLAGDAVREIGEITARSEAYIKAMRATQPPNRIATESRTVTVNPKAAVQVQGQPVAPLRFGSPEYLDLFAKRKTACIACHSGAVLSGGKEFKNGFDVENWLNYSAAQRRSVLIDHVLATDPKMLMPRDSSGKGFRMPTNETADWTELATAQ